MNSLTPTERMQRMRSAQLDWKRISVLDRCTAIRRVRRWIAEHIDEIGDTIVRDIGKPPHDALTGDGMVTLEQLRFYERKAPAILRRKRIGKPPFLFSQCRFYESYEPHGVVLIFAPYNYPFQLSVVPMATALVAGNAVLLKCSERAPQVAELISRLCREAGLPQDLVQVIWDAPEHADDFFEGRPDFVFFTGSTRGGRAVADRATRELIPCVLELGGKDPALVFADCDLDRTIEGVVYGAFANAGQVCVGIKRLYIEQPIYGVFLRKLVERVKSLSVGSSQGADIGILPEGASSALSAQVQAAIRAGAIVHLPCDGSPLGTTPIVLSNVPEDARLLREDTIGPVLCVGPFTSQPEAIELANGAAYALGASIWTGDVRRGEAVAAELNAGVCSVNDVIRPIGNPYAAFGGSGMSGYGRYHGPHGLVAFSRLKTTMVMADRAKHPIHWLPFSRRTYAALRRLMSIRHGHPGRWPRLLPLICMLTSALSGIAAVAQGSSGHLILNIHPPPHSRGEVAYLVFDSPEGFPNRKEHAIRSGFVAVAPEKSEVVVDLGRLPSGRYAVTAYQDVNGNHKLDSNLIGIPREPVGASNNPKPHFGPPSFKDCAFTLDESGQKITIELVR